jgi:acyl carrier protein
MTKLVFDKVEAIFRAQNSFVHNDEAPPALKGDQPFSELHLNSLDLIEIVIAVEDEFLINIEDEEAEKLKTIDDVVKLIYEKKPELRPDHEAKAEKHTVTIVLNSAQYDAYVRLGKGDWVRRLLDKA